MRRALLVGINHYQLPGNNLSGCVNDVNMMLKFLTGHYNFQQTEIRILLDQSATKAAILDGLNWLVSGTGTLLWHYSGHGTQVPDRNGDETDHMDEAICPVDTDYAGTHLIRDDDITAIIRRLKPGSNLSMIMDCCHSGSVDRDMTLSNPNRSKFMQLPGKPKALPKAKPSRKDIVISGGHVLLSGCRDNQTSADAWFNGKANGALTYAVGYVLKRYPKLNWRQLHSHVLEFLTQNRYDQVPQLSGPSTLLNAPIFA